MQLFTPKIPPPPHSLATCHLEGCATLLAKSLIQLQRWEVGGEGLDGASWTNSLSREFKT